VQDQGGSGNPSGQSAPSFVIPEAFKAEKSLSTVKSYDDVFKMAVEGQKALGRAILLPDEKDPDNVKVEKWNKVWGKLGRPEKPDAYDLGEKPVLPNGMEWDDAKLTKFKEAAHKLNLTSEQLKGVLGVYAEELGGMYKDPAVVARETSEKLTKELGENTFKRMLGEAQAAVLTLERKAGFKDGEFTKWLEDSGIGNDERFIRIFGAIGREMVEHGSVDKGHLPGAKTAKEAILEARKIMADKNDPFNNARHADHAERVKYVNSLMDYEDE
jgi:hypothetical protein